MECITTNQLSLMNKMGILWDQHVFWTRLLIISVLENLKDLEETKKRLLNNPVDIGILFWKFYGPSVQDIITNLLTEHSVIGSKLIASYKNNDTQNINKQNSLWYDNADRMAKAFESINPYYIEKDVKKMLYNHLDLTKNEVALRLAEKYAEDIKNFDMIEKPVLEMANYFSMGIIYQFRNMFTCYSC